MIYADDLEARLFRKRLFKAKSIVMRHVLRLHDCKECIDRITHLGVDAQLPGYTRNVPVECRIVSLQDWLRYMGIGA